MAPHHLGATVAITLLPITLVAPSTVSNLDARGPQQEFYTTPLHRATAHGDEAVMGMLLRSGADVDWMDANGFSPLHWAALRRHAGAVRLLLVRKANLWQRSNEGALAIHMIRDLECGRLIANAMAAEDAGLEVSDSELHDFIAENSELISSHLVKRFPTSL